MLGLNSGFRTSQPWSLIKAITMQSTHTTTILSRCISIRPFLAMTSKVVSSVHDYNPHFKMCMETTWKYLDVDYYLDQPLNNIYIKN